MKRIRRFGAVPWGAGAPPGRFRGGRGAAGLGCVFAGMGREGGWNEGPSEVTIKSAVEFTMMN